MSPSPLAPPVTHVLHSLLPIPVDDKLYPVWFPEEGSEFIDFMVIIKYRRSQLKLFKLGAVTPLLDRRTPRLLHLKLTREPPLARIRRRVDP